MKKTQLSKMIFLFCLSVIGLQLAACDAAEEQEPGSTAEISSSVASNIGPVSQFLTEDSLNIVNEISDNTLVALQSIYTFEDAEDIDVIAFQAQQTHFTSGQTNALINVYDTLNDATTQGEFSIEDLAQTLTADTAPINDWPGENCDISGICSCTFGGSRTYTGNLTIDLILNTGTGTISGSYSVIYNNCIEVVTLNTNDGSCNVFVDFSGTVAHDVSIDFSNFVETSNLDNVDFARRTILQNTENRSLLEFSIADSEVGPFTETQNIEFDFRYSFKDTTSSVEPVSDVSVLTFDDVEYNMVVVSDFIEDAQSENVCP